jgi:hypothetical protein
MSISLTVLVSIAVLAAGYLTLYTFRPPLSITTAVILPLILCVTLVMETADKAASGAPWAAQPESMTTGCSFGKDA